MSECPMTFSGEHVFAPRKWLGTNGNGTAPDGSKLHPWISSNYIDVIACICKAQPPSKDIPTIKEQMKATAKERSRVFGEEPGEQGQLNL